MVINKAVELALDRIKRHEGFVSTPYIDPLRKKSPERYGIPRSVMNLFIKYFDKLKVTFGYGFTYITREEADKVLEIRLNNLFENKLKKIIPNIESHPVEIQSVFLEMLYQLGEGTLRRFRKTLKYLNMRDYAKTAEEMLDSRWAKIQTPRRAQELANIVRQFA